MNLPPSKPHPELDALLAKAKAMPPMSPAELQAQRISFAFGNLPEGSTLTREDVAALDYAKYGNLAELTARAEAAEADAASRCPRPSNDDDTYYRKGKTAQWFQSLADEEFAEAVCFAAQDLNDTGLGDDLDKWMPFQVMLSNACDRINRLLALRAQLAEVQAERDRFEAALGRACLVGGTTYLIEQRDAALARADAAGAKCATLQTTLDQTLHAWGKDAVEVEELQAQVVELTAKLEAAERREAALLANNEEERQTLIRHNAAHAAEVAELREKVKFLDALRIGGE